MHLSADDLSAALTGAGGDVAPQDSVALAELAGGSVGAAFALTNLDGLKLYTALIRLFATLPRLDRPMALALAEQGGRRGAEPTFDLIVTLIDLFLSRLARAGTLSQLPPEAARGEQALIERLSPDRQAARAWADLAQSLGNRARRGRAVNLDPASLLLDMVLKIDEVAGTLAQR
jgi:DNA polymerase-3 subunit delta'